MNTLDIELINASSPYYVRNAGNNKYRFTTNAGVAYLVGFMEDSMVEEYESYQFYITNETGSQSPNDNYLWQTIIILIEEFFRVNQSVMVYWCDTSDGHEALRARLFTQKFNVYHGHEKYIFKTIETNTEGIPYYAALIFRKDHPQAEEISSKVDFVVEELKEK